MKKALVIIGVIVLCILLFAICRGRNNRSNSEKEKEKITLPDPPADLKYEAVTKIEGPLSGYVEVVAGDYLFELKKFEPGYMSNYEGKMNIKFRFLKSIDIKAGRGYNYYGPGFNGKALDDQDIPLDFCLDVSDRTELASYLKRGSGEEWMTVTLSCQGSIDNNDDAIKMIEKFNSGKKIRFNSEIIKEKFEDSSSSSVDKEDEDESASVSSTDCDKFLKGYEKFMLEYISVLKKYQKNPNDPSIISDYTSMMSKANEWAEKTANCANDSKYAAKLIEIQMKIANAISDME